MKLDKKNELNKTIRFTILIGNFSRYIKCRIVHFQAQASHRVDCDLCGSNSESKKSVIMKLYVVGLLLASSLGLVFAAPSQSETKAKDQQAVQECNITNPVYRDVDMVISKGVVTGDRIKLSQEEKCFLFCVLQKVKFLNGNADINNGLGLLNWTMHEVPELKGYSDVIIAYIFQLNRSTKGFEDKCLRSFIIYHQYLQNIFALNIAQGLQDQIGVKDKIANSIQTGQSVDQELSKKVEQFLQLFDQLIRSRAKQLEQLQS